MEPKQRLQYENQLELSKKLNSIQAHPEWPLVVKLLEDEVHVHSAKAKDKTLRQDPSEYANIVRALDNADAIQAVLDKFTTITRLGKEAQEKLDAADGII